ncbi:MAG: lipocalin family protein [Phocaeicola sp.]
MKTIFKIMMFFSLLITATACSKSDEPAGGNLPLKATYSNVAGIWKLTSWNGEPLIEGLYCYVQLNRRAPYTFVIYENMNSMYANKLTGTFAINAENRNEDFDIISGEYDYDGGSWANAYKLVVFQESMTWTVENDPMDVSIYERCNEIPKEILDGTARSLPLSELKKFL